MAKQGRVALVKTQVVHRSLNPVWNETFQLTLISNPVVQPHDILTLEVMHCWLVDLFVLTRPALRSRPKFVALLVSAFVLSHISLLPTVGQHDFLGSVHAEMAGLVAGVEKQVQLPVMSKKGTVTLGLTAVNFSVPPAMGLNDPNIVANRQIAAESARKRANYKKAKACEKNVGSVLGKDAGVVARKLGLHKLF